MKLRPVDILLYPLLALAALYCLIMYALLMVIVMIVGLPLALLDWAGGLIFRRGSGY